MIKNLKKMYLLKLKFIYFHKYFTLNYKLQSNISKNIFDILMEVLSSAMPLYCTSFIKNYGSYFLIFPLLYNVSGLSVYPIITNIPLDQLNQQLDLLLEQSFPEIERLLNQLERFIDNFFNYISTNNINVITTSEGGLEIEINNSVTDTLAEQYTRRIHVLDNLIQNHISNIRNLMQEIVEIESNITEIDNGYISKITSQIDKLDELIKKYGH